MRGWRSHARRVRFPPPRGGVEGRWVFSVETFLDRSVLSHNSFKFLSLLRLLPMGILATLSEKLVSLLCGLLGLYLVRKISIYARCRRFGGPFWAGFSDLPHSKALLQNNCHEWYADVSEKYGAVSLFPFASLLCIGTDIQSPDPCR